MERRLTIFDVVAGSAGLAGVQWALQGQEPLALLRRELSSLFPAGVTLENFDLYRAKFKPGRHLTAYYHVHLRVSKTVVRRSMMVSWRQQPSDDPRGPDDLLTTMEEEVLQRGLATPLKRLTTSVPAWGMFLLIAPLDVEFPHLIRLYDPSYVHSMLDSIGASHTAGYTITPIRYRPGERHVLRYDPVSAHESGDTSNTLFAKVYKSDRGARIFQAALQVANQIAAHSSDLACAHPLTYLAEDRTLLYAHISGTPLSQLLGQPAKATASYLRRAGVMLSVLHAIPEDLIELQPHSLEKELAATASATQHVRILLPTIADTINGLLQRVQELHALLPHEAPSFAYGDFKSDHLWVTPTGLTLIDYDTCYRFDPAIDIGKYLADLRWWYDGYGKTGVEQAQNQFLAGYSPTISRERMLRAHLYEALVLVKITARRVPLFSHDWEKRTERLIRCAEALLSNLATNVNQLSTPL